MESNQQKVKLLNSKIAEHCPSHTPSSPKRRKIHFEMKENDRVAAEEIPNNENLFEKLSPDMLNEIFQQVSIHQLWILCLVCSTWRKILNNEANWRKRCLEWWVSSDFHTIFRMSPQELEHRIRIGSDKWDINWKFFSLCLQKKDEKRGKTFRLNPFCSAATQNKREFQLEIGEMQNGDLHGRGMYFLQDYENYFGMFSRNKREGEGYFTWPNKNYYIGYFMNDLKSGDGTLFLVSGTSWTGRWEAGNPHGEGVMKTFDGFAFTGEFERGKPKDKQACLHPLIRQYVDHKKCTGTITRESLFAQFIYICTTCETSRHYCVTCRDTCHPQGNHKWEEFWTWGLYTCDCHPPTCLTNCKKHGL
jgi:hypothetical protein